MQRVSGSSHCGSIPAGAGGGPTYDENWSRRIRLPSIKDDYTATTGDGETTGYAAFEMEHFVFPRHGKRANIVFMDGSARSTKLADYWSLSWHRNWDVNHWRSIPNLFPANG